MVTTKAPIYLPTPFVFTSVSLSSVVRNGYRLDASAYNQQMANAVDIVKNNKYGFVYLWGENGFIKNAFYGARAKREYIKDGQDAIGFLGSAEMLEINPKPVKFVSRDYEKAYGVQSGDVLVSRSGTIGNTTFVSKTLSKFCVSEHAIRICCNQFSGYVYTFLHSDIGKNILESFTFGAVIDEIEPEHLRNVPIPNAPEALKQQIHDLIIASFDLRDQSNDLIDEAQELLYSELKLPRLAYIKPKQYDENAGFVNLSIRASQLDRRFDVSYHRPEIAMIINILKQNAGKLTTLGDKQVSKDIFVGNRFTRVYVSESEGTVYLNGKSILQLDPNGCNKKYLSLSQHEKQIKEQLTLRKNTILVTCSGTLGKTVIVPNHWDGWTGTHDLIRIIPANEDIVGYIYCFLNSEIGKLLLLRGTYGAVIDHLEPCYLQQMVFPLLKNKKIQRAINDKILQANELRYQAYIKEQEALAIMEHDILETS